MREHACRVSESAPHPTERRVAPVIDLTSGEVLSGARGWLREAAVLADPALNPPGVPVALSALRTPDRVRQLSWCRPTLVAELVATGVPAARADELWDLMVWWASAHTEARLREELQALARTDPLTGLLNRRGLEESLDRETARARRTDGSVCLALIDLDRFKTLNDTRGHAAGDAALRDIGDLLTRGLRANDVAGRWGGDEFAVVFGGLPEDCARDVIDRLRSTLNHPSYQRRTRAKLTFSAGIAMLAGRDAQQAELMELADRALYVAKNAGGGCTSIHT
ncbi:MAG: diguanylate cyclase [Frankiaceae bacterium]|nr:diguanylate cyclase [Frankiaceae bacterium]